MNMTGGYTNPLRSFERKMSPDYASREFRDPGLPRTHSESGLGSLRHTMPHLRRGVTPHFDLGGPISRIYANSRPNLYNPDPRARQVLQAGAQMGHQFVNPLWHQNPGISSAIYAEGGPAEDPQELMESDDNLSGPQQKEHQIVVEAMLALEGRHPNPGEAVKAFVDTFGPQALTELTEMMRAQSQGGGEEEEEEEPEGGAEPQPGGGQPDEEDDLAAAGGGLLSGPGSGQSDEIEGTTPSGRPVLLSDGEYVIDAPTVAALGDGSTNAGARRLDEMRKKIRTAAYGHDKQSKPMKNGGQAILVDLGV
jgi:hypothetical protein